MRKYIVGGLLLLTIVLIGGFYTVSSKIQELPKLDQAFFDKQVLSFLESKKSSGEFAAVSYQIQKLDVILKDETVKVRAKLSIEKSGISGVSDLTIEGYPVYQQRKFYFIPDPDVSPEFHELNFSGGVKPKGIIGRLVTKIPGVEDKVNQTVQNITSDNRLVEDLTIKAITYGLNKFPVYKLGDSIPETAAAVAIDEFKVQDKELVITISFWNLAWYLLGILVIAVIVILLTVGIMLRPEMFTGIALLGALSP